MHKLLKRVVEAIQEKLKMSVWATRTESSACDEKSETELERKYNSEFRETLVSLERKLHTTEDPSAITMEALKMVCAFHDADWAGILIVSSNPWARCIWRKSLLMIFDWRLSRCRKNQRDCIIR